jgi:hypothetical protein
MEKASSVIIGSFFLQETLLRPPSSREAQRRSDPEIASGPWIAPQFREVWHARLRKNARNDARTPSFFRLAPADAGFFGEASRAFSASSTI